MRLVTSIICVGLLGLCLLLASCEWRPKLPSGSGSAGEPPTGFIAGQALLGDAKEGTHAGILVYVAGRSFAAHTDPNGQYLISGVPAGTYTVMAEKPGYQQLNVGQVSIDPNVNTREKPFTLPPVWLERLDGELAQRSSTSTTQTASLGSVTGYARLENAPSNEGVRVKINNSTLPPTVTDEDGLYRFLNVAPGIYSVTLSAPGYQDALASVTVPAGKEGRAEDVTLKMEPSVQAALSTSAGTPVPRTAPAAGLVPISRQDLTGDRTIEGTVEAVDASGNAVTDSSRILVALANSDYVVNPDPQGRFSFTKLPAGTYRVIATLDGGNSVSQDVDLNTNKSAQVTLRIAPPAAETKGSITGRVILPGNDDRPLPDASGVRLSLAGTQLVATSARDGSFRLDNIPVASYTFLASKDGYEDYRSDTVEVVAGPPLDLGEIRLEPKRDYPRVLSSAPANGTKNVEVGYQLLARIKFSKAMNAASVRQALTVAPATAYQVYIGKGSHPQADDDTLVIVFNNYDRTNPIRFLTNYVISIANSAADLTGLRMRQNFAYSFTTGAPGVFRTTPANGDLMTYVTQFDSPIEINFNTKLRADSVRPQSVRISPGSDINLQIRPETDPRTGWTTLLIFAPLRYGTAYTLTVEPTVRAFNGQRLSNLPYTVRFHTGTPQPVPVVPEVIR